MFKDNETMSHYAMKSKNNRIPFSDCKTFAGGHVIW